MGIEGILKGVGGTEGRSTQRDDWYWENLGINLEIPWNLWQQSAMSPSNGWYGYGAITDNHL